MDVPGFFLRDFMERYAMDTRRRDMDGSQFAEGGLQSGQGGRSKRIPSRQCRMQAIKEKPASEASGGEER